VFPSGIGISYKNRGQHCGDIELVGYLTSVTDPVPLVLDLRITHDRFGSSSDPNLNGKLHYPQDIDKSLNETVTDKIRKYRADYNNNPPNVISFMPAIAGTSDRLHSKFIRLLFLQTHRETDQVQEFLQLQEFTLRRPTVDSSTTSYL